MSPVELMAFLSVVQTVLLLAAVGLLANISSRRSYVEPPPEWVQGTVECEHCQDKAPVPTE